jgi:hypothetical protein
MPIDWKVPHTIAKIGIVQKVGEVFNYLLDLMNSRLVHRSIFCRQQTAVSSG